MILFKCKLINFFLILTIFSLGGCNQPEVTKNSPPSKTKTDNSESKITEDKVNLTVSISPQKYFVEINCPNGHYHNSDLNASRNLAQYDGFSCQLDLKKSASVMDSDGLVDGLFDKTLNSMKDLPDRVNL
jgi:hypothetical protein